MNFENPFFIILILSGVLYIIGGFLMLKYPPKSINALYGYRTKRSMKNQDSWNYSQKVSSKKMIKYGVIMALISFLGLFDVLSVSLFNMFLAIGVSVIFPVVMIFKVETLLKKKLKEQQN